MKKIFLISVLLLVTLSEAIEVCSIINPNQIRCNQEEEFGTIVSLYKRKYDGSWIKKTYYPRTNEKNPAVFVDKYERLDFEKMCEGMNSVAADSYKFDCNEVKEIWIGKITKGEDFPSPIVNFFINLVNKTPVSDMHCLGYDYVRTYKRNNLTGLETDRKDYHGLKPGTYCEDFLANDGLFWKPPK